MKHLRKLNLNESRNGKQYKFTQAGYDFLIKYENFYKNSTSIFYNFNEDISKLLEFFEDYKNKSSNFLDFEETYNDLMKKYLPNNQIYKLLLDIFIFNDNMTGDNIQFFNNDKTELKLLKKAEQLGLIKTI